MMLKNTKQQKGFTLVEVVVSLTVFTILVALIFANYRYGNDVQNLEQSRQEVAQSFRIAQNKAVFSSGKSVCNESGCTVDVPEGYGVFFNYPKGTEIVIFADTHDASGAPVFNKLYDAAFDEVVEKRFMKRSITIESCVAGAPACSQAPCSCDIFFETGSGTVSMNAQSGVSADIQLLSAATEKEKRIAVDGQTGVIE